LHDQLHADLFMFDIDNMSRDNHLAKFNINPFRILFSTVVVYNYYNYGNTAEYAMDGTTLFMFIKKKFIYFSMVLYFINNS
jgi:hypothetical protein